MKSLFWMKHLVLAASIFFLTTACFRTRSEIAEEQASKEMQSYLRKNLADQSQGMERLEAEIGKLQGRIEELDFNKKREKGAEGKDNEAVRQKVTETYDALEQIKKNQEILFEEVKKIKEDVFSLSQRRMEPEIPGKKTEKKSENSEQIYKAAIKAYEEKDFDGATQGFRDYLANNKKGKKALDAQYFLGESLFKQKMYQDAILAFGVVHEMKTETKFSRKSTLRLAQSFAALGKKKDASTFAQLLLEESPTSEEAKQAKKYLQ